MKEGWERKRVKGMEERRMSGMEKNRKWVGEGRKMKDIERI